jgi:hypothetical protein
LNPTPDSRPPARTPPSERFGTLKKLAASVGWTHEAHEFTPWLAEHLDLLAGELGLSLDLRQREHPVGRYSLDLLLEDARGRVVIVENQFGQTDHDHLGKLLTYCAGTRADVVIWIAETLTEEHVAALEWLNDSTVEGVGFFGVELELLQIVDESRVVRENTAQGHVTHSLPAPHFRVVVQPNEWAKTVRPPASRVEWDWDAYLDELNLGEDRVTIGKALVESVESAIADRGLPWQASYRKGYIAFKRPGDYNVVIVDLYWNKPPRLAVKLPAPPEEVELEDPFPSLDSSWLPGDREWGWTIPSVGSVPTNIGAAIDAVRLFQPVTGPMVDVRANTGP